LFSQVNSFGVSVVAGQVLPHRLALFCIGFPAQDGPEEEEAEDGEEDEEFQDDQPDERTAPGLVLEAIPVEKPNFSQKSRHRRVVSHKDSNIFSRFFTILSPLHKTMTR
jgi:hypothetical protein